MRARAGWSALLVGTAVLAAACGAGEGGSGEARPDTAARAGAPAAELPADSLEVRVGAFLLRWVEATETRDTAALRALYAGDGRLAWLEDGRVRYRSVEEVLAGLATLGEGTSLRTVLGEVEAVRAGPGTVHAWTPFTTTVGEGEGRFTFGGILSVVLEESRAGWRILGGHTSSPASR